MNEYDRRRFEDAKEAYDAFIKVYPFTTDDLDGEIWRVFNERYHISNFGRAKSFYGEEAKILKPTLHMKGYLRFPLCDNGKRKAFRVHRLVAELFIPNPDNKLEINHRDGCKFNNYVSNLEWVTHAENVQHGVQNGLIVPLKGAKCSAAKLTDEQVVYVRTNPNNLTCVALAKMFGISETTISHIQLGKIYKDAGGSVRLKHLPPPNRLSDEVRAQIRAEYVYRSSNHNCAALAKKYGIHLATVSRIVNESRE